MAYLYFCTQSGECTVYTGPKVLGGCPSNLMYGGVLVKLPHSQHRWAHMEYLTRNRFNSSHNTIIINCLLLGGMGMRSDNPIICISIVFEWREHVDSHVILYDIILCYVISHFTILCHIIWYCNIFYDRYYIWYYIILYHIIPYQFISYHIIWESMILYRASSAQVCMRMRTRCTPLSEWVFRFAIKTIYYGRYHLNYKLDSEQIIDLINLFRAVSEGGGREARDERIPTPTFASLTVRTIPHSH